jgi:hypothetical protein
MSDKPLIITKYEVFDMMQFLGSSKTCKCVLPAGVKACVLHYKDNQPAAPPASPSSSSSSAAAASEPALKKKRTADGAATTSHWIARVITFDPEYANDFDHTTDVEIYLFSTEAAAQAYMIQFIFRESEDILEDEDNKEAYSSLETEKAKFNFLVDLLFDQDSCLHILISEETIDQPFKA